MGINQIPKSRYKERNINPKRTKKNNTAIKRIKPIHILLIYFINFDELLIPLSNVFPILENIK